MKTLKIKSIFSTILCVIWISGLSAQSLTVTGTVTDENNRPLIGANVSIEKSRKGTVTNEHGKYSIEAMQGDIIRFSYIGYKTQKVKANRKIIDVKLYPDNNLLMEECVITSDEVSNRAISSKQMAVRSLGMPALIYDRYANREEYSHNAENRFKSPVKDPLSTFSIDVDAASYSNIRRFINQGEMPPKDAVRIEEMINYFNYNYPKPTGNDPVRITTEVGICPWNKTHRLVQIGLKAREIENQNLPASNFVFLIDVSGSMFGPTRLELVKSSLRLLVNNLREKDRVAIVTYCGDARVALPSTPGNEKQKIKDALETLTAGGSTAGGAGIKEAYRIAQKNFIAQGNNRIILCTDGDFNVGASSETELENLIESKRKSGIFLTVLGYGMGNYKDNKMQILAQKGNGNHAYIDNIQEANKVLVNEFGSTMYAVAKDVKLQVEFNPAKVQSYRLVGYETRMLNNEDFNDDTKDAGEMGAGHTVTALYEIIPTGTPGNIPGSVDPLKYQSQTNVNAQTSNSSELLTVKLRYKTPEEEKSKKIEKSVTDMGKDNVSPDFRFASAVAMFAQLLKDSDFKDTIKDALQLKPDRIALFNYAHVPWMKAAQKALEKYPMPTGAEKVGLFGDAMEAFKDAGFEYIGLDHFALPQDELILARKSGTLQRNFQGYSTRAGLESFGLGLTSISQTKNTYRQNFKIYAEYEHSVKSSILPIERGIILSEEDELRREIIMDIMCLLKLDFKKFEEKHGFNFREKFQGAFPALLEMQKDGILEIGESAVEVSQTGRLFLRNIAMLFDGRLSDKFRYSKTL